MESQAINILGLVAPGRDTLGFYESISAYYDEIFPASPQTVRFLSEHCRPQGRLLDVACGTGNHALELARRGFQVTGVDLDQTMLEVARKKSIGQKIRFVAGDMCRLVDLLGGEAPFDTVFCIGNSLVHLGNEDDILQALRQMYALLAPAGKLVAQIVNFDRVLRDQSFELPLLSSASSGLTFKRVYEYDPQRRHVLFCSELNLPSQPAIRNAIPLLILESPALRSLADRAGYRHTSLYGSYAKDPHSADASALILVGTKTTDLRESRATG